MKLAKAVQALEVSSLTCLVCLKLLSMFAQVVLGVVYNPVLKELFSAVRGEGATLNGQPIQVSETDMLQNAMLGELCFSATPQPPNFGFLYLCFPQCPGTVS